MRSFKLSFVAGFSLSIIQASYGALSPDCADQLYTKYHANEYKEVMKHYEQQYACFGNVANKAALPIVPASPARMAPQTITPNSPFKELVNLKPKSKDWIRLNYFLRYPDFRPSPGSFNEETNSWNPDVTKVTGFPKKAYDCAMAAARKSNEELFKFYLSIVSDANTNCGRKDPVKTESQLKKEMETFWYNVINYNYKNDGMAMIYPFAIDPKFEGSFSGKSKLSFVYNFVDNDGTITPRERYTVDINCQNDSNTRESAWQGTLWGRQCSDIEKIIGSAAQTPEKIYPDDRFRSSQVYYKGMKTLAMPSSPVAEKKEAKSSTEVQLVKTGANSAEIRAYGNLYYDDKGNLVKGVPTSVTAVQCDGGGASCSDVLKDFEKTYAKTPSYIVDKATAMNTLLYEKPEASAQAAPGSGTSSATGTTQVTATPVKTALPSKAPEVELIDNGDGTAKLMFFNDFYYNQNGELVRNQASQITTVQCGKNKSVTCDQVLADAKNAMKDKTGYLVTEPGTSANSSVPSSASNLTEILAQAASKAQTSLTCGQNDLVVMGTSLQQEIEAIKKRAIEEIEKVNAKYKKMAQDKGCNIPEAPSSSSSQSTPRTSESNSLERVMGAF